MLQHALPPRAQNFIILVFTAMAPIVLVAGATGKQGFATVRHLLAARAQVHALVRDPSSPASLELVQLGARICPGTFDDLDSLKAAAAGTTAVFLNVTPTIKRARIGTTSCTKHNPSSQRSRHSHVYYLLKRGDGRKTRVISQLGPGLSFRLVLDFESSD